MHRTILPAAGVIAAAVALTACGPEAEVDDPCGLTSQPEVQITPQGISFGTFNSHDSILLGNPPQGGGAFAALSIRIRGYERQDTGQKVVISAYDSSSELRGTESYQQRFICSNTGENVGFLVSPPLHVQFNDDTATTLHQQAMRLEVVVGEGASEKGAAIEVELDASAVMD